MRNVSGNMKILIVSHEYPPIGGGGANACLYLSHVYAAKGHDVTVITANYHNMDKVEVRDNLKIVRVNSKREHIDHSSFVEMLDFLLKAWKEIRIQVRSKEYQLCHVFFGIPSGVLGYILKKRYHIPYVVRFGGGDIPGAQKRFALIYKLLSPFIKGIWANADYLVANSRVLREKALQFYDKKEVKIISNGVDCDCFYPAHRTQNEGCIRLLFVSRLIEGKGLQYVIPELERIQEQLQREVHLDIVGNGPYKNELENLVKETNTGNMVRFHGQKSREQLLPYYQNADVFILPSLSEGMPNVVLEAMACGIPIIMTPCGGSEELISENGIIVEIKDFCNKLAEVCRDKDILTRMGEESRKRAETLFSWKEKAEEYLNLFYNVVDRE